MNMSPNHYHQSILEVLIDHTVLKTYLLVGSLGLGSFSRLSLLVLVLLQQGLGGEDFGLRGDGSSGHC